MREGWWRRRWSCGVQGEGPDIPPMTSKQERLQEFNLKSAVLYQGLFGKFLEAQLVWWKLVPQGLSSLPLQISSITGWKKPSSPRCAQSPPHHQPIQEFLGHLQDGDSNPPWAAPASPCHLFHGEIPPDVLLTLPWHGWEHFLPSWREPHFTGTAWILPSSLQIIDPWELLASRSQSFGHSHLGGLRKKLSVNMARSPHCFPGTWILISSFWTLHNV